MSSLILVLGVHEVGVASKQHAWAVAKTPRHRAHREPCGEQLGGGKVAKIVQPTP